MHEESAALQLAGWVGRKSRGLAKLRWGGHELTLSVSGLQVVGAEGDDGEVLMSAFGAGVESDWLARARAAVASGEATESEAVAVVKRALKERLYGFFRAPDATAEFEPGIPEDDSGFTISYPHIVVEMLLGPGGESLLPVFIPDPSRILRRLPDFPRRVGALQLTDQALAILAKINDLRSTSEIADPSPHGRETVMRLLAATVGAGLVETVAPLGAVSFSRPDEVAAAPSVADLGAPRKRRGWLGWVAAFVVVAALALVALWQSPWGRGGTATSMTGPWSIAVDGGCEPAELERLYRRRDRDPQTLEVVPFGRDEDKCYRLVWGHFPTQAAAEGAVGKVPDGMVARGFTPHVVRVDTGTS